MIWQHRTRCPEHDSPCDCEPHMKIDEWELSTDAGERIGIVQQFGGESSFYGNTAFGRTGAMTDRLHCQAEVEKMLENPPRGPFDA